MPLTREQPTVLIREVFAPQTQVGFGSGRPPTERPPAPFGNGQEGEENPLDRWDVGELCTYLNGLLGVSKKTQH